MICECLLLHPRGFGLFVTGGQDSLGNHRKYVFRDTFRAFFAFVKKHYRPDKPEDNEGCKLGIGGPERPFVDSLLEYLLIELDPSEPPVLGKLVVLSDEVSLVPAQDTEYVQVLKVEFKDESEYLLELQRSRVALGRFPLQYRFDFFVSLFHYFEI